MWISAIGGRERTYVRTAWELRQEVSAIKILSVPSAPRMVAMARPRSDNPKNSPVYVRLTQEVHVVLAEKAALDGVTLAALVRSLCEREASVASADQLIAERLKLRREYERRQSSPGRVVALKPRKRS